MTSWGFTDRKTQTLTGFYEWTPEDEQMAREGVAIKGAFRTTAEHGTSRRKAKLSGGPKNRQPRADLLQLLD